MTTPSAMRCTRPGSARMMPTTARIEQPDEDRQRGGDAEVRRLEQAGVGRVGRPERQPVPVRDRAPARPGPPPMRGQHPGRRHAEGGDGQHQRARARRGSPGPPGVEAEAVAVGGAERHPAGHRGPDVEPAVGAERRAGAVERPAARAEAPPRAGSWAGHGGVLGEKKKKERGGKKKNRGRGRKEEGEGKNQGGGGGGRPGEGPRKRPPPR